jgi:hypothetical protein
MMWEKQQKLKVFRKMAAVAPSAFRRQGKKSASDGMIKLLHHLHSYY